MFFNIFKSAISTLTSISIATIRTNISIVYSKLLIATVDLFICIDVLGFVYSRIIHSMVLSPLLSRATYRDHFVRPQPVCVCACLSSSHTLL